jgi:recombinational DNA repair ATPase RecF
MTRERQNSSLDDMMKKYMSGFEEDVESLKKTQEASKRQQEQKERLRQMDENISEARSRASSKEIEVKGPATEALKVQREQEEAMSKCSPGCVIL